MESVSPIPGDTRSIVLGAVVAAAIVALALGSGGYPTEVYAAATAGVWLAVLALLLFGPPRERLPSIGPAAVAALLALAGVGFLSASWAADSGAALLDAIRPLGYAGVLALLLGLRSGDVPALLAGVGAGAVAVAGLAFGSAVLGFAAAADELALVLPPSAERLSWPIGYWNGLGTLVALGAAAVIWAGGSDSPRLRATTAGVLPLLLVVVVLSGSRGALVAGLLAAAVTVVTAASRPRALLVALAGLAGAAPAAAIGVVVGVEGLERSVAGAAALLACAAGGVGAALVAARWTTRAEAVRVDWRSWRARVAAAAALALALAGGVVTAVQMLGGRTSTGPGQLGFDSGRGEFWRVAIDAAAQDPLRGIGGSAFGDYWNANGSLDVPVGNPHSLPLEILAELGMIGLAALLGFGALVLFACIRAFRRGAAGPQAGAAAGILLAGAIGCAIDWIWDLPAVIAPVLIAVGALFLLGGPAPAGRGVALGPLRAAGLIAGAAAVAVAVLATAFSVKLAAAESELDRGDVEAAAREARVAVQLLPSHPRPHIVLAELEQAAGNLEAARREAEVAVRLGPDSYRGWLLLGEIHTGLGNDEIAEAYTLRGLLTGGVVLARARRSLNGG